MENLIHEECGIFGIYDPSGTNDVASSTYYGLFALQHRGQESCGIAVNDRGVITYHKDVGLVRDVFSKECLEKLGKGQIAVGQHLVQLTRQMHSHSLLDMSKDRWLLFITVI